MGEDAEVVDAEPVEAQALVVLPTGEALMRGASDAELAQGLDTIARLEGELKQAADAVGREVVSRMDQALVWSGKRWTFVVGDREYKVEAPSPDAGTTAYNPDVLAEGLAPLVEDGTLSQEAVDEVLVRTVTASVVGKHCDAFKKFAARYEADVEDRTRVAARGVNALGRLRNERVDAAIEKAKTVTPAASRKVKLKVETKQQAKGRE